MTIGDDNDSQNNEKRKYWNLANIHTLVLARSTVDYKAMRYLLSMGSLKSLHVELAYRWDTDFPVLEEGEVLLQGLGHVSSTLERLSIGMELYPDEIN